MKIVALLKHCFWVCNFKLRHLQLLLLGLAGVVLLSFCLKLCCKPPAMALVNINAIVQRYIQSMAKSTLNEEVIQERTAKFMKKLEEELHHLARDKKIGLLVSEAILAGGVDYTVDVERRTYQAYHKEVGSP